MLRFKCSLVLLRQTHPQHTTFGAMELRPIASATRMQRSEIYGNRLTHTFFITQELLAYN